MMAKPWNQHRETITKLYIQEGRTLEDVRGIMKTEYNFQASIRSYRQHFDIWDIGKYNCKKRQQRRRQSLKSILPSPGNSPDTSDPGSSPASSHRDPEEQRPLPPALLLQQPPRYAYLNAHQLPALQSSSVILPEPRVKVEGGGGGGGGGTSWRDMPVYTSATPPHPPPPPPPQSVLQSNMHYTTTMTTATTTAAYADWPVHRPQLPAPPLSPPLSSNSPNEYCGSAYRCVPEFPRHGEMATGLRAPNLAMVRGHGRDGALHPLSVPVGFH